MKRMQARRRPHRSRAAIGILAIIALVVAACGGGSGDTTTTADAGATTTSDGSAGETTTTGEGEPSVDLPWATHEDLVAAAEAETGEFKVYMSTQEESITEIQALFSERYPFVDISITEQSGSDAQRILLETEAGANDYDVLYLSQEVYADFLPYLEQVNLAELVEAGVLDMPVEMVNPNHPYTMAAGSGIAAAAYNPTLLDPDLVPVTWEDYLKPELKGRVFLADIEPVNLATLIPAWGEDKVREFATQILAQEPVWARGETNALTTMAAGEYALHFMSNYHSSFRAMGKSPDSIAIQIIEPIPVRLTQAQGIRAGADNLATSVLFLELLADPEIQSVFDELEPRQSSIYAPGSEINKIIEGKELSLWDWEWFDQMQPSLDIIVEAWGFPVAEISKD